MSVPEKIEPDTGSGNFNPLPIPPRALTSVPNSMTEPANPFAEQFKRAYEGLKLPAGPNRLPRPTQPSSPTALAALGSNAGRPASIPTAGLSQTAGENLATNGGKLNVIAGSSIASPRPPKPFRLAGHLPMDVELQMILPSENSTGHPVVDNSFDPGVGTTPGTADSHSQAIRDLLNPHTPENQAKLLWWKNHILEPTRRGQQASLETNSLVYLVLKRSPRLRSVSQTPLIREQQIEESQAEFDPVAFLQSQLQDRVDPVGDSLSITNDGTDFLDDHIWNADIGIRRKTATGGSVELGQRLGFRNSNSAFFSPQDQGTATISLNVSQPLLRGRGRLVNRSQILIAEAAGGAAWDTLAIELQEEVQMTVDAYWRLYFDRSIYLQKHMNVRRAEAVLDKLEGRAGLDSLPSQIARARAAVLSRKTQLANAVRDIRNSETEIRRLTADPNWAQAQMIELLPVDAPNISLPVQQLEHVIAVTLNNRPEIRETIQRSKIAAIQRNIGINELLPELTLLLGTYVSALEGESRLGDAFVDQFSNRPGYSVGVEFEMPIRSRAARSRLNQQNLQLNAIKAEVEETVQNVIAEAQVIFRRVISAKETLAASLEAMLAANLDLEQNKGRWESFALIEGDIGEGQTPTTVLDQLLDSQDRLSAAEMVFAQAELELKSAETALQQTMGTLLNHRSVTGSRRIENGVPVLDYHVHGR